MSVCQSHIIYNFILVWHDIRNSKGITDKLNRYAEQSPYNHFAHLRSNRNNLLCC